MNKSTMDKILEYVKTGKNGTYTIEIEDTFAKRFKEKKFTDSIERGCICKYNLSEDEKNMELEVININNSLDELEKVTIDFMKNPEIEKAYFDEMFLPLFSTKVRKDFAITISKYIYRCLKNMQYRGYKLKPEERNGRNFVVKEQIYKYKAKIFAKNNIPYISMEWPSDRYKYKRGSGRSIRLVEGLITMQYKYLNEFMEANEIDDKEILLEEDSIESFYSYNDTYFVKLTPKFIEGWWQHDCPDLYRCESNIIGDSNGWGITLVSWSCPIIQTTINGSYIDESITDEEVEKIGSKYKNTAVYADMMRTLQANKKSDEEKKQVLKEVKAYTEKIQKIIDSHEKEILEKTVTQVSSFYEDEQVKLLSKEELQEVLTTLEPGGFDCGFLNFAPADETIELVKEAAHYDTMIGSVTGQIRLQTPWHGQSTSIKRELGNAVTDIVKKYSGNRLTSWTVLD